MIKLLNKEPDGLLVVIDKDMIRSNPAGTFCLEWWSLLVITDRDMFGPKPSR